MQNHANANADVRHYRSYGLNLASLIPLPELPPGSHPADVAIRLGSVQQRPEVLDHRGAGIWVKGDQACHFRKEAGAFLAIDGRELIVDPNPLAAPEVVRLSILGPALGLILHQRGTFALHASAVEIEGSAVVFVGANGAGKSTMAALMHARGHTLVCDDVTPIDMTSNDVRVVPSFPQIKLWPDSANAVGSANEMPVVHPDFAKRAFRPSAGFTTDPVRLRRIYILKAGDQIGIENVAPLFALQQLMASWYAARFGATFCRSINQTTHFQACARLAKEIPMRVLARPAGLHQGEAFAVGLEDAIRRDLMAN